GNRYRDVQTWYPRSQGLGGCTIHNALINLIPHKWDFEQVQKMFNNEPWGWKNMTKYYTRCDRFTGLRHGAHTAIRTGREPVVNKDYNNWRNDETQGGSWITLTKEANGTRVRDRLMEVYNQNPRLLKFAFESWPTKVLTGKTRDNKIKAYGVEALQGANLNPVSSKLPGKGEGIDRVRRWYAKKEVILSACPFETPKLLMHSGIGDRDCLKKYNIKPLVNSPGVGPNLQDRVEETTVFTLKNPHVVFQNCTFRYDPAKDPCLAAVFDFLTELLPARPLTVDLLDVPDFTTAFPIPTPRPTSRRPFGPSSTAPSVYGFEVHKNNAGGKPLRATRTTSASGLLIAGPCSEGTLDRSSTSLVKPRNTAHFLDVAKFTIAFSVGYDWLYNTWTDRQMQTFRTAVVTVGLQDGLEGCTSHTAYAETSPPIPP
ncbi:hypothetical protein FRC00_007554, partial [Tulasnella sp. 408]